MLCELRTINIPCLSITPRKKEFNWLNSDFRKFIDHVYTSKQLDKYFKIFFNNTNYEVEKIRLNKKPFLLL